ncbi:MAG: DUF4390 domain-containing protein [Candidatus Competibacteraceae bacterium]|jgi:hypothetical protein|nr:DUF4390 domain-containing protein [Candidatus Competibacteraceae bacterium]
MVFITLAWPNSPDGSALFGLADLMVLPTVFGKRLAWLCLLVGLSLTANGWASSFKVVNASTRLDNEIYRLYAQLDYQLSQAPLEALQNGVPLTFSQQVELIRKREWLWDEVLTTRIQRFTLAYHALSRQYVVTDLDREVSKSFPDATAAFDFLGNIDNLPLVNSKVLNAQEIYYVRLRTTLDLEKLPVPLLLVAYLSDDWYLSGEWYTWPL